MPKNKKQKPKFFLRKEAQALKDEGVDLLAGEVIRQSLADLFVDTNAMKTAYNAALKDQAAAIRFFKSKDSWFRLTGIELDYILRAFPGPKKTLRTKMIRELEEYPRFLTIPEKVPFDGVIAYLELAAENAQDEKDKLFLQNTITYLEDYVSIKKELKALKDYLDKRKAANAEKKKKAKKAKESK